MVAQRSPKSSSKVTEARAVAQRDKLDAQAEARRQQAASKTSNPKPSRSRKGQEDLLSRRRSATTLERAIADFLDDQEGGNHSAKTLEWHRTALKFFEQFLKEERAITLVAEIDAPDISAWFASMRKTPTGRAASAVSAPSRPTRVRCAPFATG
jgi:integrase/recombinase XerD